MMMNRTRRTELATAALTLGAAMAARGLRARRGIDFRGRSVLITGGSRGLGLVIARELGQQGARVTLAARDEDELERARQDLQGRGVDVATIVCDVGVR